MFISRYPILAIPADIKRNTIEPIDFDCIQTVAGGFLTINIASKPNLLEKEVQVSGQVVYIYVQIVGQELDPLNAPGLFYYSPSLSIVRKQIQEANRIWSQAGVEIRERKILTVPDPGNINHPNYPVIIRDERESDPNYAYSEQTHLILGTHEDCNYSPSPCLGKSPYASTDINVYYFDKIAKINKDGELRHLEGIAFSNSQTKKYYFDSIYTNILDTSAILLASSIDLNTLAHEIAHIVIRSWPGISEHHDLKGNLWSNNNLMYKFNSTSANNLHQTQSAHIIKLRDELKTWLEIELDSKYSQQERESAKYVRLYEFGKNYCAVFEPNINNSIE
jgi:hypothetical protein